LYAELMMLVAREYFVPAMGSSVNAVRANVPMVLSTTGAIRSINVIQSPIPPGGGQNYHEGVNFAQTAGTSPLLRTMLGLIGRAVRRLFSPQRCRPDPMDAL
jgi:hypothetical protein